jgi:hypothetical protein
MGYKIIYFHILVIFTLELVFFSDIYAKKCKANGPMPMQFAVSSYCLFMEL